MASPSVNIFQALLRELGVPHTKAYAIQSYEAHPYKYTFYGLKRLCDHYHIHTEAVHLNDKEEMDKLPTPFIADLAGDYVLVKKRRSEKLTLEQYGITSDIPRKDFLSAWGGNALVAYPGEQSAEPDLKAHQRIAMLKNAEGAALAAGILALIICCASICRTTPPSISVALSMLLSLAGTITCIMLLSQQLHLNNPVIEKVCHAFRQSSCHNVLDSSAAKLFGRYSWSVIGLSYFAANFICQLLSDRFTPTLAYLSIFAIPYSVWSVAYQRRMRSWCPLCLIVQGLIGLQCLLYLVSGIAVSLPTPDLYGTITLFSAYLTIALTLNALLPFFSRAASLRQTRWQYSYLKMNAHVFDALLRAEKQHPTDGSTIAFGRKDSPVCLTIFSNPYCNPCAAMHKRLQALIDADCCRIEYVFTSFRTEWDIINRYLIAAYQQLGEGEAWRLLTEWYDRGKQKQEAFFTPYKLKAEAAEVKAEFDRHEAWRKATGFQATPTLLVNGHKLPYGYQVEDLLLLS